MSVWYKNTGTPGNIYPCIVTAGNSGANSSMFIGFLASPSLSAQPSFYYNGLRYGGSSVTFTNGVWTSVQVTWDGTTMTTYLNGVLSGTATPGGVSVDGGGNYKIGICWDVGTNSYVTGEIGEIRIYGSPLNSTQILADYNATKATYDPVPLILLQASSYTSGSGTWSDQTFHGKNATLTAGTGVKNGAGNGIILTGSSYWTFADVGAQQAWTVSTWYKNTGSAGTDACIVTQSYSNYGGGMINLYIKNNGAGNFIGGFLTYANIHNGTPFNVANTWKYYQITWDGTTITTYINGVLFGTAVSVQTSLDLGQNYYIGCDANASSQFVTGEIGEVRIYGVPLTQAQITTDYNNTKATYGL
jgi:hypothetical protein